MSLEAQIKSLPNKPGIYQYFDEAGKLIYVGKAKSLKKRVSSYFTKKAFDSGKTAFMVKRIVSLKFLVVETEYEAMLLENSLIKEHQPRFNIQWRDDKSFPFIKILNERFPRVFGMRNPVKDGAEYFGPYASVKMMRALLDVVTKLYTLRNCNFDLAQDKIDAGKYKVCLEYHIGNCKGPCENKQSEADYNESIEQVRQILKGRYSDVIRELKVSMQTHAEVLEFEDAEIMRRRIEVLEKFQGKSTVVNPSITHVDVFSLVSDLKSCYVNYMKVVNGAIVQGHTVELKKRLEESDAQMLDMALVEMRQKANSDAKEVIVPFEPGIELPEVHFHVPQRGDKRKLLELSEKNAKFYMLDKRKQEKIVDPERHTNRILEQLKKDLRLSELPRHIECFDNSNFQGTDAVAACVVFRNAKPFKKDYRHFNIRSVEGPDDFASMEEVVHRRYARLLKEGRELPQLVVIDGGKGQLSSAMKSVEQLGLKGKMTVIGIAKKLEEIYFPEDPVPLHIDKRSESLKVVQHLRNEAHRFGIEHHRKKRSKRIVGSTLQEIPGIGPEMARKLLSKFRSVKNIKAASVEDVAEVVGKKKAMLISNTLNSN